MLAIAVGRMAAVADLAGASRARRRTRDAGRRGVVLPAEPVRVDVQSAAAAAVRARPRTASFVEPDDLVLAVRVGDDAAAYPIRQMAYHHLVNDRIGRTPAVVTY